MKSNGSRLGQRERDREVYLLPNDRNPPESECNEQRVKGDLESEGRERERRERERERDD